jgi:predicted SnoaL-like aldol condensation-catalyzing enzyme
MTPKELVLDFYKNDLILDKSEVNEFLHPDILIEWNSSKGFIQMTKEDVLNLSDQLSKAYVRSKIRITHCIAEGNMVSVRFTHFVKTIENPREEMLLAHFFVIWEVKDDKLYRGYQMSQFS